MSDDVNLASNGKPEPPVRRVAAVGDFHCDARTRSESLSDAFRKASEEADVLLLLGDMTTHGEEEQAQAFAWHLQHVTVPMLAVLGNHDHETGHADQVREVLEEAGVRVLEGDAFTIGGVGFAGAKGFGGGFAPHMLTPFGEAATKAFVDAAIEEELKLERALGGLTAPTKIVLLHYLPHPSTLGEEPLQIWPFMGSSRLLAPIEAHEVSVVFHGHAHLGAPEGTTPAGVPLYNVALPVLQAAGMCYRVWSVDGGAERGTERATGAEADLDAEIRPRAERVSQRS
jgi:Icc-related predicted phosphoesterase